MRAKKGSKFERTICKQLGLWWTDGARDDIFWRSSQSGGRATQRTKKGLQTFGSYGDIAAVDPIGQPLLQLFTIELKRGSSHKTPGDLIDCVEVSAKHSFAKALLQAKRSSEQAGTPYWLLICKRDHRCEMVYIPLEAVKRMPIPSKFFKAPSARYKFELDGAQFNFVGLPLSYFLVLLSPAAVTSIANALAKP